MNIKRMIKKFIPGFLINFYHYLLALIGAFIFGFPGKKIIVIGVTGTSGKSTTVNFITEILEESGAKVASVSSIKFKIGEKEWKNELKMTMPGRFAMQKFLKEAVKEKCKFAVLEVTSEGIRQHRHRFINFDTVIFTNLSPEHIESHGGFENYRNEKLKLFKIAKNIHIINIDDENARYFLNIPAKKKITFGLNSGDINLTNTKFHLNVLGDFNRYNALAAISSVKNYGVSLEICNKALGKIMAVSGRMEIIQKEPFLVVVDYAHTPEQLEKVYQTFSSYPKDSKLICLLGSCGGGRDKWKRPVLGKIASQYCGKIIITNEDPYDENPSQILSEIKSGISNTQFPVFGLYEILDRKEAIKSAIELAEPGDRVIITGKGSETLMCLGDGKKIPWSDRKIVADALKT